MPLTTTLTSDATTVTTQEAPTIKQGDAIWLPVTLYFNGAAFDASTVILLDTIEYSLTPCCVRQIDAGEAWNSALGMFLLPIQQADTLHLCPGYHDFDVRAKFHGGGVLGVRQKARIMILDANSREVI